jgi:uncharacterized membrane protein (DUF2068 family)
MQRPTGVTVMAILAFIGGIFGILGGLALVGFGGIIAASGVAGGGLASVLGVLLLVYGVLALVLGYGFWTLQPWAWTLGVGLQGAGIVINVLQFINDSTQLVSAIVSIAISAVILWYLFQPHVKAAFGRT